MLLLLAILAQAAAPPSQRAAPAAVRAITSDRTGSAVVITVQTSGVAKPSSGKLIDNPLRLYFDLPGVLPGRQRQFDIEAGSVSHVRIGLNKPAPPVTRVVIELSARGKWRIEPGDTPADVRIVIEDAAAPSPRAAASTPAPPGSPGRVIFEPAPAPAPAPPRDRRAQIMSEIFQMSAPLDAMRAGTGPSDTALADLIAAAERLSASARAMQVSGSARDVALVAAIDGVLAAARARAAALADGSAQSRENAIAAANGALLLLRHAEALFART